MIKPFGNMSLVSLIGLSFMVGACIFAAKEIRARFLTKTIVRPQTDTTAATYGHDNADRIKHSIKSVVAAHSDYTAEILPLYVKVDKLAERMKKIMPGAPVELWLSDSGGVSVFVNKLCVGRLLGIDNSRIPSLLESGEKVDAYLGGRDVEYYNADCDFCSIIAFYKMDGVPPTKVNLEF